MLYYGDGARTVDARTLLSACNAAQAAVALARPGAARHDALVSAFIAASQLHQAIADAAAARGGGDLCEDAQEAWALAQLMRAVRAVMRSWRSNFAEQAVQAHPAAPPLSDQRLCVRTLEGYAFYGLQPETDVEEAARLGPAPDAIVVVVRSVGAGLACLVAATIGSPHVRTVRPIGAPLERTLRFAPGRSLGRAGRLTLVVDEGPGLTGGSFAAAIRAAHPEGAARVIYFPSHLGMPDHRADPAIRALLARTERAHAGYGETIAPTLSARLAQGLGAAAVRLAQIRHTASHPFEDRIKVDVFASSRLYRAKFAGLGAEGAAKWARAKALAAAGFAAAPASLAAGFLIEAMAPGGPVFQVSTESLARKLAFRGQSFPAPPDAGASPSALAEMIAVNADEAKLTQARRALRVPAPGAAPAVICDGRLLATKFLRGPHGRALKTDALDHGAGHDLVGPQPIAFDVAGAGVELRLSARDLRTLAAHVCPDQTQTIRFFTAAYAALHVGRMHYAVEADPNAPDRAWREREGLRYRSALAAALGGQA